MRNHGDESAQDAEALGDEDRIATAIAEKTTSEETAHDKASDSASVNYRVVQDGLVLVPAELLNQNGCRVRHAGAGERCDP